MNKHDDRISRRAVLGGLTAAFASAGCSSSPVGTTANDATAATSAQLVPLATAEMGEWASRVGATFSAAGYGLRLSGVEPLPSEGARPAELR